MKERQSHMSMVARFAYIFATIVTIFAQMGAAAPAMIVSADFDPNTLSVTSDISTVKKGDELTVSVSGDDAPRMTHWFNLGWVGDGLTFDSAATSAQAGYSSAYTFTEQNPGGSRHNIDVEVHNDSMSWPIKFIFKVGDVSGQAIKFLSMDYNAWPSTQAAIDAATALTINTNGAGSSTSTTTTPSKPLTSSDLTLSQVNPKTAYDPATTIDTIFHADLTNYPTQYRDVQFKIKETADGTDTNTAATFDPDATATLAKSNGFTVSGPVASDDHTVYSYTNNGMYDYKIWLFKDNSIRIEYPKGTTGTKGGYIAFKANTQATKVTLTPVYVGSTAANDTPAELVSGTATSFAINAPKAIDATTLSMNPVYAAPFDYGNPAPAYLSNFPFFYIKDTESGKTWYSFDAYTNYTTAGGTTDLSKNDLLKLRAGIVAGLPFSQYNVTAASSNSTRSNAFENLHQIAADGSFVAGTEKKLSAGKIYTLYQYNPLSTASPSRYKRLSTAFASHYWYMPDGIPTFSVGSDGKITLHDLDKAAGKSIKGAWSVDSTGKQIINRFFHVKYIRVVDQNGDAVPNATLTMNNTTDGDTATMTGSTGSDGANGELLPDDYVKDDDGPFYYADGVESFKDVTLPAGYSKENMDFSSLTLDPATDYLKVDGATTNDDGKITTKVTNSTTDDHFRTNQILTLTVHKYTSADNDVTIKKVDQSDTTKVLGGATFKIAEQGNTTDPLNTTTKATDSTTGLTTNSDIKQTSDTKTRVFKVTEDAVPSGYAKGNSDGYYATWVKGTGFTGVGDSATTATAKTSADGLATVTNGQLQIADPSVTHPGGGDSKMKIQYVDSAKYNNATKGTTIAGAQLPVLNPAATYGNGSDSFSGLGGIIYNPSTTTPIKQTADTMTNSTEVSGDNGIGIIQNLWSVDGLVSGWDKLITNTASAAWILRNAIATNTIPATPAIYYQLLAGNQTKYFAPGSTASGYYNLGSTIAISSDGTTLKAGNPSEANKYNKAYRDNPIKVDTATNTAIIQLYKVKQVKVVDTAGKPVVGATVTFTGMSNNIKTNADGIANLTPTDGTNIFPNAKQYLQSVKQGGQDLIGADGAALTSDNSTKGFAFEIANGAASTDKISATVNTLPKDASISADGQTVQITTQAPTTIKIHKQSKTNAAKSLAGATFKVWTDSDKNAVTTSQATDADGNTSVTLANPDPNDKYHITEDTAPTGYTKDTKTYDFTWTAKDQVTGITDPTNTVSATNGTLNFADTPKVSGGVGDNGTNGGTLTINKIDGASGASLAGAKFTVTGLLNSTYSNSVTTDSTGKATFNLGDPASSERLFSIHEDTAPSGYTANNSTYYLRITSTGEMYLGNPGTSGITPNLATQTTDGKLKFASTSTTDPDHTIKFADDSASQPIKITKMNPSGTALQGAKFQLSESDINGKPLTNGYSISQTTPTNGTVQFTPNVTDTAAHYYLLQETAAPAQYATGASEVVVYQGGKVTGVKTLAGSSVEGSAGPLTKNADSSLTYVDQYKPMPDRTISVRTAITNGETPSLRIVNRAFKVTLQSVSDPTKVYPINIDAASGEGTVSATALATAMGYSSAPEPTKTDTFWLSIDPEQSNYSVPVKRQVTFSWDREKGGFKVVSTQNDNMVDDDSQDGTGQSNASNKVGIGNLRMYLRRDTLVAQQDVADVNQAQPLVPNAQFTLNYMSNGTLIATQNVKTNDFGVAVLQAPTAKDMTSAANTVFPINQTVDVQLTQTNGTKIPGYQNFTKTAYLKYYSATGFTVPLTNATTGQFQLDVNAKVEAQFDPDSGDEDPTTVPVSSDSDTNSYVGFVYKDASSGVVGTQYAYAGTQLLVPLTQAPTAALTDAPQVMNFGKAQISTQDQNLNLIPSTDTTNAANFDTSTLNADAVADGTATDDLDDSGEATDTLNAAVTQTGTLTGGWRLDMAMSDLTGQDSTSDTVPNSSVSMATPKVTLTPSTSANPDTSGMGIAAPIVKMDSMATAQSVANTGSDSAPGDYKIAWNLSDVKMHLPAFSGKLNTNYHSTISWDLITAP